MEDPFTQKDLDELLKMQNSPCLSMFMPTFPAGPEVRQNHTRFKNLFSRAERLLSEEEGLSATPADFLSPLRAILHDNLFWSNQSLGLALFRSAQINRIFRIPRQFREIVAVSDHFHIKPLLSFLRQEHRLFILALSKKEVRLIECSLQKAVQVDVQNLPRGMDEALGYDDPQSRMQFRTGVGKMGERPAAAVFHAHGTGQEKAKDDLLRYFQLVNKSLEPVFQEENAPLVIAAVDYLIPIYAEANTYANLLGKGIAGNPEGSTPEGLKSLARPIMETLLREREEEAISDYEEKSVRMPSSTEIREVVPSAYHRRVDSLFLSEDDELWGGFNPENDRTVVEENRKTGLYDLLNFAAIHSLHNGGAVIPLPRDRVPGGSRIAALFRY